MKAGGHGQRPLALVLGALLVASGLALVTSQHRARGLFIDLESAQRDARQLDADRERLRIELGRAAQPAMVETAARRMGFAPAAAPRTVLVPGAAVLRAPETGSAAVAAAGTGVPLMAAHAPATASAAAASTAAAAKPTHGSTASPASPASVVAPATVALGSAAGGAR